MKPRHQIFKRASRSNSIVKTTCSCRTESASETEREWEREREMSWTDILFCTRSWNPNKPKSIIIFYNFPHVHLFIKYTITAKTSCLQLRYFFSVSKSAPRNSDSVPVQSLMLKLHYISVCTCSPAKCKLSYSSSVVYNTCGVSNIMHLSYFLVIAACCNEPKSH